MLSLIAPSRLVGLLLLVTSLVTAAPSSFLQDRDVGTLTCETVYTGRLQWIDFDSQATGYVSTTGPKINGKPVLHTTRANGDGVPFHKFNFQNCTSNKGSTFIDYYDGNPVGHIESVEHPGKCLTATQLPASGSHGTLVLDDCYYSDDSGQLLSTFVYARAHNPRRSVNFLGYTTRFNSGDPPNYGLKISKAEYGKVHLERLTSQGQLGQAGLQFFSKSD